MFEWVNGVCHGPGGLLLLKLPGIFLLWIHTVHWMCSWTCLDHFHMSNTLESTLIWLMSHLTTHGYYETVFAVYHGSGGLLLLKLLRNILLWIHNFHWMCSWTCLDRFHISKALKSALIWQISHRKMANFRQFLSSVMDLVDCCCWNSPRSFFYGSILSIECVAGHVWAIFTSQTPLQLPWSGGFQFKSMAILRQFLCCCWNSSGSHSFMDQYFPLNV
jgi:hypothetical protein